MQNTPIFEENGPENFKGIDIMRAVRSFDPCLPCGVHMYRGGGKVGRCSTPRRHWPDAAGRPRIDRQGPGATARARVAVDDARARRCAQELTAAVVEMYGAGLERMMDALEEAPAASATRSSTTRSSRACC